MSIFDTSLEKDIALDSPINDQTKARIIQFFRTRRYESRESTENFLVFNRIYEQPSFMPYVPLGLAANSAKIVFNRESISVTYSFDPHNAWLLPWERRFWNKEVDYLKLAISTGEDSKEKSLSNSLFELFETCVFALIGALVLGLSGFLLVYFIGIPINNAGMSVMNTFFLSISIVVILYFIAYKLITRIITKKRFLNGHPN